MGAPSKRGRGYWKEAGEARSEEYKRIRTRNDRGGKYLPEYLEAAEEAELYGERSFRGEMGTKGDRGAHFVNRR